MEGGGAYGAGKSGEPFHPLEFIKRPKTIARLLSWIFALVVFACIIQITNGVDEKCIFGNDPNACNYGLAIGIMSFITATVFIVVDLIFASISSAEKRKKIVISDLGLSGVFALLFFVGFCYLTNAWTKNNSEAVKQDYLGANNARAAISFAFFSIFSWGVLAYLAFRAYKQGTLSAFAPTYADPGAESSAPYTSFPGAGDMSSPSYQQGPFAPSGQTPKSDYQPPTY